MWGRWGDRISKRDLACDSEGHVNNPNSVLKKLATKRLRMDLPCHLEIQKVDKQTDKK